MYYETNWNTIKLPVLNKDFLESFKEIIQILALGGRRLYYVLNNTYSLNYLIEEIKYKSKIHIKFFF